MKQLSAVRTSTFLSSAATLSPWDKVSRASNSSAGTRVTGFRQSWLSHFGFDDSTATCMLTGTAGKTNLAVAHIIPLNIRKPYLKDVNMVDKLNHFRNAMLLCKSVEKAFNNREVSIVRSDNILSENEYVLKVWDMSKCARTPIIQGSAKMISDYNGQRFLFKVPQNGPYRPFKRALSYHNFWCFIHWSKFNGDYSAGAEPDESSSETRVSSIWLTQRKGLLNDLRHYINTEEREEDNEEEEFGEGDAFADNVFEDAHLGAVRSETEEGLSPWHNRDPEMQDAFAG